MTIFPSPIYSNEIPNNFDDITNEFLSLLMNGRYFGSHVFGSSFHRSVYGFVSVKLLRIGWINICITVKNSQQSKTRWSSSEYATTKQKIYMIPDARIIPVCHFAIFRMQEIASSHGHFTKPERKRAMSNNNNNKIQNPQPNTFFLPK